MKKQKTVVEVPQKQAIKPVKEKKMALRVPEMVTYSMKMVIPTGAYANIQPEIVVKAGTIEEAHNFIAPHMNKLWKEYFLINERRPEPAPVKTVPTSNILNPTYSQATATVPTPVVAATNITAPVTPTPVTPTPVTPPPVSSVAFTKANQAIESCVSLAAFEIIMNRVMESDKLTDEDKNKLMPILQAKSDKLNNPQK